MNKKLDLRTLKKVDERLKEIFHTLKEKEDPLNNILLQFNTWLQQKIHYNAIETPEEYEWFLLETETCPICKKRMIKKDKRNFFPSYYQFNQKAQLEAKGMSYTSDSEQNGDYVCIECEAAGLTTFKCALCEEIKPSSKLKESFGNPDCPGNMDYLCEDCYSSVSAKIWDKKEKELNEAHRYDYE